MAQVLESAWSSKLLLAAMLLCVVARAPRLVHAGSDAHPHASARKVLESDGEAQQDDIPWHVPFSMDTFINRQCLLVQDAFQDLITANLAPLRDYAPLDASSLHATDQVVTASIVDGHVYVDSREYKESDMGVVPTYINAIAQVNALVQLPDVHIPLNMRDEPQAHHGTGHLVLGYCRTSESSDVLVPYGMMGFNACSRAEYLQYVHAPHSMKDATRLPMVYWRGTHSGHNGYPKGRSIMHEMHLKHPGRVNVGWADWDPPGGRRKPYLSMLEATKQYKYHLWIPGNCGSVRLPWQLLADVVVFKIEHEEREWMHPLLQPFVHYIPVHANETHTNVIEMLDWAESHLDRVEDIRRQSTEFALRFLSPTAVECYWALLLREVNMLFEGPLQLPEEPRDVTHGVPGW